MPNFARQTVRMREWSAASALLAAVLAMGLSLGPGALEGAPADAPVSDDISERVQPVPAAATDLLFLDFYQMPVGPLGLEPTAKLMSLDGKPVRIRGYMAHQETPTAGMFILSPLPVELGDQDESLADDLPPTVVFVHLEGKADRVAPHIPGILQLTGVLSVGPQEEPDGHVSQVRMNLDPAEPSAMMKLTPHRRADQ